MVTEIDPFAHTTEKRPLVVYVSATKSLPENEGSLVVTEGERPDPNDMYD